MEIVSNMHTIPLKNKEAYVKIGYATFRNYGILSTANVLCSCAHVRQSLGN